LALGIANLKKGDPIMFLLADAYSEMTGRPCHNTLFDANPR
jgi:hypothetical protein